jgi:NTE family protein
MTGSVPGDTNVQGVPRAARPSLIGLALGGGGGKGAAHIGVLSALAALEVPIDLIAGTSIGALVAAFYAIGYTPFDIEQWFQRAAARGVLQSEFASGGFIGTRRIRALLHEALDDRTFADTAIPIAMVAADLVTGREVVLQEGSLVDAVLATTAIPALFPPVAHGDHLLVDGGVLNNTPVDVAYGMGASWVIGVDLGGLSESFSFAPADRPNTPGWHPRRLMPRAQLRVADRALAIIVARMTADRMAHMPPTVLLQPSVGALTIFDISRTLEGRIAGERATFAERAAIEEIRDRRAAEHHGSPDTMPSSPSEQD